MRSEQRRIASVIAAMAVTALAACADTDDDVVDGSIEFVDASMLDMDAPFPDDLPYARSVESFEPGDHAGFGQTKFPDVVLGPPRGGGEHAGSLDVLSLGVGGSIVLGFGDLDIVDEPGPDFVVFENAFRPSGSDDVFADLGEVSVSTDGSEWHTFACEPAGDDYQGCAGWTPTLKYDAATNLPIDVVVSGGDAFDLQDLGLTRVRYVRLRDLATEGSANSGGFDLDAVGLVHYDERM